MVRQLTIQYPNAFYHVFNRGVNRQEIFLDREDFQKFLSLCNIASKKFELIVHSYCLMTNHYHLFIQTPKANVAKIMKFINENYAMYFVKKYDDKDGHVFRGRYKRRLVQSEKYTWELSRYIHLNPVKAKMVQTPQDWYWSSYRSLIGLESAELCLNTNWILGQFGSKEFRIQNFIQYTEQKLTQEWKPKMFTVGKTILGDDDFVKEIYEKYIDKDLCQEPHDLIGIKDIKSKCNKGSISSDQNLFLTELEKTHIEAFLLKDHAYKTYEEIALTLGRSTRSVRHSVNFMRRKLQKMQNLTQLV